jgi:glyoxylase-like metal-dependent hydrolase (beta-lactamase superfamily II)
VTRAFETVKVADGVYAFVTPEPRSGIVSGNSMAVIGDDGVLVVDATGFLTMAELEIAALKKITNLPVRYVVTTHWHQDHLRGDPAYRAAYPGVAFIDQRETVSLLATHDPENIRDVHTTYPAFRNDLLAAIARGTHRDGRPLTPAEVEEYKAGAEDIAAATEDWKRAEHVEPTLVFDSAVTVHLGKREVRVMHPGRGNTAGDTVVYVPDAKVLATGDLVVAPTPYGFGAYPREWLATLRTLESYGATTLVPGHGPVEHDGGYVKLLESTLDELTTGVAAQVKRGASLEETRKAVPLDDVRPKFTEGKPSRELAWRNYFYGEATERAWLEARGRLGPE